MDISDKLNEGDPIAENLGIAPQLAALELMIYPKKLSLASMAIEIVGSEGWNYLQKDNPPIILFIWGRKRVLPAYITNLNIKEQEFDTNLNPRRATVSVALEVIEGYNIPFIFTKGAKDAMAVLNLVNIPDIVRTFVPI